MAISPLVFSKTLAYLLRHHPHTFGITLEADGWASMEEIATALTSHFGEPVPVERLLAVAAEKVDKQRYEVRGGFMRAVHGHSVALAQPAGELLTPPAVLYHGTIHWALPSILEQGLLPKKRQYVHLSETLAMAEDVGSRRKGRLVLLEVAAGVASSAGLQFRRTTSTVWLAEAIAPEYLTVLLEEK